MSGKSPEGPQPHANGKGARSQPTASGGESGRKHRMRGDALTRAAKTYGVPTRDMYLGVAHALKHAQSKRSRTLQHVCNPDRLGLACHQPLVTVGPKIGHRITTVTSAMGAKDTRRTANDGRRAELRVANGGRHAHKERDTCGAANGTSYRHAQSANRIVSVGSRRKRTSDVSERATGGIEQRPSGERRAARPQGKGHMRRSEWYVIPTCAKR